MKTRVWDTRPCPRSCLTFSSSCMKSIQRIGRIFGSFSPLSQVSRPTSCLTTAFLKTYTCRLFVSLVLSYAWVSGTEEVKADERETYKRVTTQNRKQACPVEGANVRQINRHRVKGNAVQRQNSLSLRLFVLFLASCCESAVSTVALRQRTFDSKLDCAARHIAKWRLTRSRQTTWNHHLELNIVGVKL